MLEGCDRAGRWSMSAKRAEQSQSGAAARLLGWLNFSDGRPDPKWQRQLDDSYGAFAAAERPWDELRAWLSRELDALEKSGNAAFRDCTQARAALDLIFDRALRAYRRHHADLLAHLPDGE